MTQLHYCGINASLNLHTYNGKMYSNLHAKLGLSVMRHDVRNSDSQLKKMKPSKLKRKMQRKQAFEKGVNDTGVVNVASTPATETMCESVVTNSLGNHDQTTASQNLDIKEDVSVSCCLTREEHFPPEDLKLNDDATLWTPPSEEDFLHYLREHGHLAHNLMPSSDNFDGAVINCGLPSTNPLMKMP